MVLVVASGALPALWNLSQLEGLHRSAFLVVYFGLNLVLPFVCGFWTTVVWRGATPAGVILLAVCAGVTEAAVEAMVLTHVTIGQQRLVLATEDYVAWLAVVCLFAAGGLYTLRRRGQMARPGREQTHKHSQTDWLMFATGLLQFVGALAAIYPAITHH